ncbi:hypothetical protein CGZ94_06475 [Enemella evansiae]|uniref:DUF4260 family protein n=1 Tax=Enemella evansiae TaxID=2016499 RepID=A0A255GEK2_9ACTN|nr:hypothetical protein CGZ96_07380 [Enemella evansiae]OYO14270.1 hypothetical protein CGZ94_06475 [Enemella evansiae]
MIRMLWGSVGVAVLAFAVFEAVKYGGWTWLALAFGVLGPDLAFLAGLGADPRETGRGRLAPKAVPAYNLAHRAWLPILFLVVVSLLPIAHAVFVPWFVFGLAWLTHIAIDRAAGYGLRDAEGWVRGRVPVA